jgi:hypothetical protein
MNADVFKPPVSPISAHDPPSSTSEQQQDAMTPLDAMHIEAHQAPRASAKEGLQSTATSKAANEEIPAILAEFLARSSSHGLDCQAPAFGHGKVVEFDRAAKNNNMKGVAMERESFSSGTMGKYIPEELKPISKMVLTPKKSEQYGNDGYQGKENEPSFDRKHGHSVSEETKVKREMETPTRSPLKPDAETLHEQGTEPTTSCFYPIIPPYPYSPYGFHPIPPFMANHMTPQGGPALYNSFGHAYYSPAPYSDMYTMYPMMQHYPTAPLETPTRPRVSPQIIDNGQNESQKELYGMSPKSKDKDEAR